MDDFKASPGFKCLLVLSVWAGVCWSCSRGADGATEDGLIREVRKGHPRLMLLDQDVPALRRDIREDRVLAAWYKAVRQSAESLLNTPVIEYQRDARDHMLGPCRQAVDRIYRLGLVYRLERDKRFAHRAIEELVNAAGLKTWDPGHFLDTAELTHAVAIGYDWFYKDLAPEQRLSLRDAIRGLGLEPSLVFYKSSLALTPRYFTFNWALCKHNWNQVCNGGMAVGALAIADEDPGLAGQVLAAAMRSIRIAMAEFRPDGGWSEGPGYWGYATTYNVYFLAALETAIGPQAIEPYLRMPGFDKTGEFGIHLVGPLNLSFNFADSDAHAPRSSQMFWMARKFDRPVYAWHAARFSPSSPQDILWYRAEQKNPEQAGLPLDAYFRHAEVAFLRSAWEDPNAVYVGFKGGDNASNHSHLDLGSFVLDADGCRWALDLGGDNYALPGYFAVGKSRYYRLKTEGHNTLLFDGRNQRADAKVPIVAFRSRPDRAFAVADLSQAYGMPPGQVLRGIALMQRRYILIQDDMNLTEPTEMVWQMHTRASVALQGPNAALHLAKKTLTASIVEPPGACFELRAADPPPPQAQRPDVHKIIVRLKLPPGRLRLAVVLCPGEQVISPDLKPLTAWIEQTSRPGGA